MTKRTAAASPPAPTTAARQQPDAAQVLRGIEAVVLQRQVDFLRGCPTERQTSDWLFAEVKQMTADLKTAYARIVMLETAAAAKPQLEPEA
ncbi:MAG TPA: hypothetical protein VD863_06895 [Bradyrhizobium sp.]|nr:hypothetical protein [Bradyrhizobium sp.]